jgi:MFS family permease
MAIGCILFFIPQFTAPAYRPQDVVRVDELCSSNKSTSLLCETGDDESLSYYLPIFVIARLLIGIGAAPICTVGINYMDDCSTREKFAKYSGMAQYGCARVDMPPSYAGSLLLIVIWVTFPK